MAVPLHVHSWYSLLEGATSPQAYLRRAATCGYTALALTDSNNLYGAVEFTEQAHRYGIRPLLGACLRQQRTRCVALIAEQAGYRSLCRILSRLHLAGEHKPDTPATGRTRLTNLLLENAQGLHVLVDDAVLAEQLRDTFGSRLWLEIVRPARSVRQEQELLAMGRRLGLRPIASTATHFAMPQEYPAFRMVTAVSRATLLDQLPARLSITPDHHLLAPEELQHRFRDLPSAVHNTDVLAEQLQSHVLPREVVLPQPRLPRRLDAASSQSDSSHFQYLELLGERGLRRRGLGDCLTARQRLRDELTLIEAGDLAGYFLVVRDITRYARRRGYSMALRGSAGNSLVCFLLEITDVDPLRFGLPLERFLHAGRADLPDIDLDFDWKVRDDVIAYVIRRYGPEHTAMISSHLFLQPRSAFREASKAHGLSTEQVSQLLETLSERVEELVEREGDKSPTGRRRPPPGFPLEAERWPRIVMDARLLLGRPHHLSVHPGGIVITPRPIENYVPLQRAPKGVVITQFEKDAAEHIGLVKIDLLGNRALATVDAARLAVGRRSAQLSDPPLDDSDTIALLQRGDTLGVNQLESPAMRHLLIQMQPQGLEDVIQALAMIRPGAASVGMKECFVRRRRGLEPVRCAHPSLEPLLRGTQGLMLYEDDALRVLQALTGLAAPDADRFRKRVSKHRTADDAQALTEEFLNACARNQVPRAVAADLWVQLAKFNHYSFCKSHAVSYGLIAWKAAFLKVHYPLYFWTAALNNNQGMYPRRVYIEAIKRAGIPLHLPCVNRSAEVFAPEDEGIRVGMGAIASLDEALRAALLADRQQRGPYRNLADFRRRLNPGPEALGLLIRCGALDFTGQTRPALFLEADLQDKETEARQKENGEAASALFPFSFCLLPSDGWSPADYDAGRRLRDEWELLGFVVGPRLMALFRPGLPDNLITSRELPDYSGRQVRLAGLIATARHTPTADGRTMQFVTLEDEWGLIEVTLFPGT
ncbi:MAG TPA: DNA polymerase III subunit alpha, partial [Gemmataceae bacterium]|nr:DNA polymerase III subunit alpha [Gemmataceae bacterium]